MHRKACGKIALFILGGIYGYPMVCMVQGISPRNRIDGGARGLWRRRPHPNGRAGANGDSGPDSDGNASAWCPNADACPRDAYACGNANPVIRRCVLIIHRSQRTEE